MVRRIAIACFHDDDGVVDDYYLHLLHSLEPFVERTVFVSSGSLRPDSHEAVAACVDQLLIRDALETGMQIRQAAFEAVGYDTLATYDEAVVFDHTIFAPIFPFAEMFGEMETRNCDFWGVTACRDLKTSHGNQSETPAFHLHTHFIVLRKTLLQTPLVRDCWQKGGSASEAPISNLDTERAFTQAFRDRGFGCSVYISDGLFETADPLRQEPDVMMLRRSPVLKRDVLAGNTTDLEADGVDVARALDIMSIMSDYDQRLIWQNLLRIGNLRTLNENAVLTSVLADEATSVAMPDTYGQIAVCAHVYYTEMLPEILAYSDNIPVPYDFIATTDSEEKRAFLEASLAGHPGIRRVIVRLVEQNRGRDISALLVTCRDLFVDDRYDLVCRIHTKKTPQVQASRGNLFKRHMLNNLLNSRGYVVNILNMAIEKPWIGLFMPPIVQISFNTLGHAWYSNRQRVEELAQELGLRVKFDLDTPVAPYGTMFWFRPKALRKLFERQWQWEEFNAEPNHKDGGLAHAIERLIAYVAQDAGYATQHVVNTRIAAQNYVMMEFKLAAFSSRMPLASFTHQLKYFDRVGLTGEGEIAGAAINLMRQIVWTLARRSPRTYALLRRFFKSVLIYYRRFLRPGT